MTEYSMHSRQGSTDSIPSLYSTVTPPSISHRNFEKSSGHDPSTPRKEDFSLYSSQGNQTDTACSDARSCDKEHERRSFTFDSSSTTHQSLPNESDSRPSHNLDTSSHPLSYRRSTRELVSRYEAISSAQSTPSSRRSIASALNPPYATANRLESPLPQLPGFFKAKDQTFSFWNLLTAFGKKNKSPEFSQQYDAPNTAASEGISLSSDCLYDCAKTASTPFAFRTGPALYLSYSTSPPSWHLCSLTLHPSHLALTYTQDARHITHTIPLLFCADVHSLGIQYLDSDVPTPAMATNSSHEIDKEAHIFEMTFEGYKPAKERLAAWSVVERGRWVSAIWDAILACRDPSAPQRNIRASSPDSTNDVPCSPPLTVTTRTIQTTPSSFPPFPLTPPHNKQNQNTTQYITFKSPTSSFGVLNSERPHSLPSSSELSSTPSGQPPSPSLQTLGSMSIVRQRLARLDSRQSSQSSDSPCTGLCAATSRKHPDIVSKQDKQSDMSTHTSKLPENFIWNASTASRFSHHTPKNLFTALDAHSMTDGGVESIATDLGHLPEVTSYVQDSAAIHAKLDHIIEGLDALDMKTMRQLGNTTSISQSSDASDCVKYLQNFDGLLTSGSISNNDLPLILTRLEELRNDFNDGLPRLSHKIDNMEAPRPGYTDIIKVLLKLDEIKGALDGQRGPSTVPDLGTNLDIDMSAIHAKLDGLASLCTTLMERSSTSVATAGGKEVTMHNITRTKDSLSEACGDDSGSTGDISGLSDSINSAKSALDISQIAQVLDVIRSNETYRALQAQQQADSVRYLNELNSWLESFVTSTMGQMQQVSTGVDQLCKEWLPAAEDRVSNGRPGAPEDDNIFASLQHFLAEREQRKQEARTLQATIYSLMEFMREDMEKNTETRVEMARQAQIQEKLVKGLAAALTNEIRGERLRFVEAMKDATSINVDLHVEEVKGVLARLHQEKMALEHQIADLFSFVGKQKQEVAKNGLAVQETLQVPQPRPRRPLPQVKHQ